MPDRVVKTLRVLGIARMASGAGIFSVPGRVGWLFAGEPGKAAAVSIFARGFAARDVVIGAGLAASADDRPAALPWLAAATVADAADALGVLLVFRMLPARHRWLAFFASVLPAVTEGWVLRLLISDR